ncbi:S-adenosyl-L-methionine-dependent methyltransferase [Nemania sp. FL0916]|nr:S-adenosyl-L-methionine-dependent methyltransferase [Nemania sp. FL0916]
MAGSKPEYVFTRDYLDRNRLNLQHYQWVELFGYRIHPKIPPVGPQHRIADVGTGSGVWLMDLSSRLPASARLDGLDVSLEATTPTEWLPSNVSFREWDIKQEPPEDLVGQYDIVHVRLLIFVLLDDEIPSVLQRLMKLLKPGGYLQWDEADISSSRIEKARPDNKVEAVTKMFYLSQRLDSRLKPTWVPRLGELAESAGMSDVKMDKRDTTHTPPYLSYAMYESNLAFLELLARTTRNEAFAKELEELMPAVAKESRDGACWDFTRYTMIAKKTIS